MDFRWTRVRPGSSIANRCVDPGGTLQLAGDTFDSWQVENGTPLNLQQVHVLYRAPDGLLLTGRLNELAGGSAARVPWEPNRAGQGALDLGEAAGDLDVREIGNLALRGLVLRPGDARLVAWTDDVLPGLTIQPTASQSRVRTVVLVNLRYGPLPPPRPDTNLMVDVKDAAENPHADRRTTVSTCFLKQRTTSHRDD